VLLSKDARSSWLIFSHVLGMPLYDAGCCPAARKRLLAGDVLGAIAEWRRLADLGSGPARCILAFVHLMGAPTIPADLEEARHLATSAIAGDRGYANYLLGCIALKLKDTSGAVKVFMESHKAGFTPALTMLASILSAFSDVKQKQDAAKMFRRAAAAGHVPARLLMARLYLSGQLGFRRRLLGWGLLPIAFVWYTFGVWYHIFSIGYFQFSANSRVPLFREESISRPQQSVESTTAPGRYVWVLRLTHALAALAVAGVLVAHVGVPNPGSAAMVCWALYPYGLSYRMAARIDARMGIAVTVHTVLMLVVTVLISDAYAGHLLDIPLTGGWIALISLAQTFLLTAACGVAAEVGKRFEQVSEPIPAHRSWIFGAHMTFGAIAAGAVFARSGIWTGAYWQRHGVDLVTSSVIAALPFGLCAAFSWGLVTTNRWRPCAYLGVLVAGALISIFAVTGDYLARGGLGALIGLAMFQLLLFCLAAEWALDETEW